MRDFHFNEKTALQEKQRTVGLETGDQYPDYTNNIFPECMGYWFKNMRFGIMIISDQELFIRKMTDTEEDYIVLKNWRNNDEVNAYYGGHLSKFSLDGIKRKYKPRILGKKPVVPCFIELSGRPVGYIQFYLLYGDQKKDFESCFKDRVFGIDLFIGEPELWNSGIGTRALKLMVKYLFDSATAREVYIDPQTWNLRAVRCYEKCGFKKIKILPSHEKHGNEWKDNLIMRITKGEYEKNWKGIL